MVWNGSIVKLLGVDCSFNCFDVGRVSCWHGTWRLASSSGWHLSPSKRARFNTVSCPWTRVAELGRDAAHVGGDLLSFEHLASPAAECPSWVSFSIQHGPTRCQRRSLIPRAFTAVDDCGGFTGRLGWSHGNTSWRTLWQKKHLHRSGRSSPIRSSWGFDYPSWARGWEFCDLSCRSSFQCW